MIDVYSAPTAKIQTPVPEASDSDDEGAAPGIGGTTTLPCMNWPFEVTKLPFADWPFALLEVDLSTKKLTDHWGPMDPEMAEAIGREAQKEETQFEICLMVKKVAWVYKIDFLTWMQTNLATGKIRAEA